MSSIPFALYCRLTRICARNERTNEGTVSRILFILSLTHVAATRGLEIKSKVGNWNEATALLFDGRLRRKVGYVGSSILRRKKREIGRVGRRRVLKIMNAWLLNQTKREDKALKYIAERLSICFFSIKPKTRTQRAFAKGQRKKTQGREQENAREKQSRHCP